MPYLRIADRFFLRAGRTAADDRLNVTMCSDELAYRMRQTAPSVMDITSAGEHTKTMCGIDEKATDEFGCTPFSQNKEGCDHNPNGFSIWLAGGGVKQGFAFGDTDEFGHNPIKKKVHLHDLNATLLHLMGDQSQGIDVPICGA